MCRFYFFNNGSGSPMFWGFFVLFFSENTSSNSYGDSLSFSSELTCEHFNGTGKLYTSKKVRFNYPEKERSKIN